MTTILYNGYFVHGFFAHGYFDNVHFQLFSSLTIFLSCFFKKNHFLKTYWCIFCSLAYALVMMRYLYVWISVDTGDNKVSPFSLLLTVSIQDSWFKWSPANMPGTSQVVA
jgi:hypothetical protein